MSRKTMISWKQRKKHLRVMVPAKRRMVDPVGFLTIPSNGLSDESKVAMREYRKQRESGEIQISAHKT